MQNNDLDFMKKLFNMSKPTKEDMFFKYVHGIITKQQLDEFMAKLTPKG